MTKQTSNCARGPGHDHFEAEIVAALWEEVPFPRLPSDAPPELRALVIDIENPRRIYSIHRATRRHNLQLLVEAFIAQLRYGCGYDDCPTASCFSCRRRLAGKAPIRRYSPMSARTLAIHMASQDNPEQYLCPKLELRKGPNDAIKPLIFGPKPRLTRSDIGDSRRFKKSNENAKGATAENLDVFRQFSSMNPEQPSSKSSSTTSRRSQDQHGGTRKGQEEQYGAISSDNDIAKVSISERPVRKDYRSFAANVFGTVTVKMLEWLAPNNLAAISEKGGMSLNSMGQPIVIKAPSNEESDDELFVTSTSSVDLNEATEPARHDLDHTQDNLSPRATNATSSSSDLQRRASLNGTASGGIRPMQQRTNPHARLRTSSKTKSLSTEFISETIIDDSIHMTVPPVSPVSKSSKLAAGPNRSSSGKTHLQRLEHNNDGTSDGHRSRLSQNVPGRRTNEFRNEKSPESANVADNHFDTSFIQDKEVPGPQLEEEVLNSTPNADILPQSISRLSHETIDFLCEVLQQDGTSENHHFEPRTVPRHKRSSRSRVLRRRRTSHSQYPQYLRLEWKLFVEQSIFNVLSDPFAVVESFTTAGSLTDSQTLWYHMLRMTRTAPSLVFDSLWQASATLFAPPKALRFARSPTANVFPRHVQSMSNEEAGVLISVCFHALAAAAPVVHSHSQLFEMSRIRSRGSTLADSGNSESTILSLQYDDAFTDEMAIRLARRVMAAIPTRKYFDELVERDANTEGEAKQTDVLSTLLAHLEPGREVQVSTEFSYSEREVHEKRVPILLLDWARTIMLDEWQGTPDVPGDGPFGGALSLIAAICKLSSELTNTVLTN